MMKRKSERYFWYKHATTSSDIKWSFLSVKQAINTSTGSKHRKRIASTNVQYIQFSMDFANAFCGPRTSLMAFVVHGKQNSYCHGKKSCVSWWIKHIECGCDFLWETIRDRAIITSRVTSDKLTAILSNAFTNLTCISIRDPCGRIDIHLSIVNGCAQNDEKEKWTIFLV